MVSIVIPALGGADRAEASLGAVSRASGHVPCEVIVGHGDEPGYVSAVNAGAAQATGEFVAIVNEGVEPREGWLAPLLERAAADESIAIVAPKVVGPGGLIHEAGGLVLRDGALWKYGNGHFEGDPAFDYARDTDYAGGEAMLIRAGVLRDIGGLDERFSPGPWSDADLALEARSRGHRVVYEPASVVVRPDGGTPCVDPSAAPEETREQNRGAFAEKWAEALKGAPEGEPSHESAYTAVHDRQGPLVLVVDHRLPEPERDAGSARLWAMIECLRELGCSVMLVPDDGEAPEPSASRLRALGVEVLAGEFDTGAHLGRVGHRLDLAVLCRPNVAPRYLHAVRRFAPGATVVYDSVDLHFLREERRIAHEGGTDPAAAEAYREIELALVRAVDVTLVASTHERDVLAELAPGEAVEVLPTAHAVSEVVPPPGGRAGQLFVGGFQHDPNVDAALHLARDIMPGLREELGAAASLTIAGPDPPAEVLELAANDIEVTGWVEDLTPLLDRAMVSVAPLRYGAGMKGKVTQSMAAGVPVVTTGIGAEGLGAESGRDLLIADEPAEFVAAVARLDRDPDLWNAVSDGGRALVARVASHAAQLETLRAVLGNRFREVPR